MSNPSPAPARPTIRTAIFGNGFARTTLLPCLRQAPRFSVVGIASPNLEKVKETAQRFEIPLATADYRELLAEARPELVFVVTPPHRHLEMSIDALAAGCHVVCEKPTAMSRGESERMLQAARARRDRLSLIHHELRFDPGRLELRRLAEEQAFGQVLHATYTVTGPARRNPNGPWSWWSDRHQGGGTLGALGSHAVDALRSLLGEVEEVTGQLATFVPERVDQETGKPRLVTADDQALAWLRFRSGARATLFLSLVEMERRHEITLAGTKGGARWVEQAPLELWDGSPEAVTRRSLELGGDLPPSAELGIPDTDWARCCVRFLRRLAQAIDEGAATLPGMATFHDGHETQRVLDAIRRSDELRRPISLDEI